MSLGDITGQEAGVESLTSQDPVEKITSISTYSNLEFPSPNAIKGLSLLTMQV